MKAAFKNFNWIILIEGMVLAPRATAGAFSQLDDLERKAWTLVVLSAVFGFFLNVGELYFAHLIGYQNAFFDMFFAVMYMVLTVATFPILKWLYEKVLSVFGTKADEAGVTSVAALTYGINIWLTPLLTIGVILLTLFAHNKPEFYDSIGIYLIIPYLIIGCWFIATYIDGLFNSGMVRSYAAAVAVTLLHIVVLLFLIILLSIPFIGTS